MKVKNILLVLFFAGSFSSLFANDNENISRNAVDNFQKEFSHAENIQWTATGPLTRASFELNGEILYAYYVESGERVALGRNIELSHLPLKLISTIKSSYKQHWITSVFEITENNESAYYATIENADQRLILKSTNYGEWMVYKRSSK